MDYRQKLDIKKEESIELFYRFGYYCFFDKTDFSRNLFPHKYINFKHENINIFYDRENLFKFLITQQLRKKLWPLIKKSSHIFTFKPTVHYLRTFY